MPRDVPAKRVKLVLLEQLEIRAQQAAQAEQAKRDPQDNLDPLAKRVPLAAPDQPASQVPLATRVQLEKLDYKVLQAHPEEADIRAQPVKWEPPVPRALRALQDTRAGRVIREPQV